MKINPHNHKTTSFFLFPNLLNESLIQEIKQLTDTYAGNSLLKLNIIDEDEGLKVNLLSRKVKIRPDNDLLKKLDEMDEVGYNVIA